MNGWFGDPSDDQYSEDSSPSDNAFGSIYHVRNGFEVIFEVDPSSGAGRALRTQQSPGEQVVPPEDSFKVYLSAFYTTSDLMNLPLSKLTAAKPTFEEDILLTPSSTLDDFFRVKVRQYMATKENWEEFLRWVRESRERVMRVRYWSRSSCDCVQGQTAALAGLPQCIG